MFLVGSRSVNMILINECVNGCSLFEDNSCRLLDVSTVSHRAHTWMQARRLPGAGVQTHAPTGSTKERALCTAGTHNGTESHTGNVHRSYRERVGHLGHRGYQNTRVDSFSQLTHTMHSQHATAHQNTHTQQTKHVPHHLYHPCNTQRAECPYHPHTMPSQNTPPTQHTCMVRAAHTQHAHPTGITHGNTHMHDTCYPRIELRFPRALG